MKRGKVWTFVAGFVTAAALVAIVALRTSGADTGATAPSPTAVAAVQDSPNPTAALNSRDV